MQHVFANAECFGRELDITDKEKVTRTIKALIPDVVINVLAYTDVYGCEENIDHALSVNGEALEYTSRVCSETGAILIRFSIDYVFDGTLNVYRESDISNPINVYGRSKLPGETNIIENMVSIS